MAQAGKSCKGTNDDFVEINEHAVKLAGDSRSLNPKKKKKKNHNVAF